MTLKSSNKVETNRYQLEIAIDGETFEKAVNQAYNKEKKKITVPGFRKGKAPRAFIEKYYGDQVFYEDAINALYPDALDEAVKEAKLDVIEDKVDFDLISADKEGLVFKATVTTKPEVTIEGYKGIAASKKNVEVTDADIDAEIKKVQERNSRMVTVEDRAAQKDDITVLDFEGFVDGTAFEGGKSENFSLTLGSGQFIPGFEEQVIGHKSGEEFDINVKFPEDYQATELANKEAVFKIKLHEVKEKELPEVDDDFVKDVSDFDTLDAYKEDIKAKLLDAKTKDADEDVDNQLIDKLVELVQAEVPQAMYENKINEDLRDFSYRLQAQGLDFATYLKYTGTDLEGLRKSFQPQAERQVKVRLALEKIAEIEKIQPTDEEVEAEYDKLAKNYEMEAEKVKGFIPVDAISQDIAVEKAIQIVRDAAVISEKAE